MKKALVCSILISTLFVANSLAVQYSLTELGSFTGALYINDKGQIAANYNDRAGTWSAYSGFTALTDGESEAIALNNNGQIVGQYRYSLSSSYRPSLWVNGTMVDMGADFAGVALGINDNGVVVGKKCNYSTTGPGSTSAWVWDNGVITDLGEGYAKGINNRGQIVGTKHFGSENHVVIWEGSEVSDLGTFGSPYCTPIGINDSGQVLVGTGPQKSFIWDNGVITQLEPGTFGGNNDLGQIIGSALSEDEQAFACIWDESGNRIDLNTLLSADSGVHLSIATGINNLGQIVALTNMPDGTLTGYLLTPIPEPGMMILLGLGAMMVRKSQVASHKTQEGRKINFCEGAV